VGSGQDAGLGLEAVLVGDVGDNSLGTVFKGIAVRITRINNIFLFPSKGRILMMRGKENRSIALCECLISCFY